MKSVVNEIKKKEFPKLMNVDKIVVLFKSLNCGTTIINAADPESEGEYSEYWEMDGFKDFHGTVTLSND